SAAGCKRALYILPAMPPLALALGCYLDARLTRAPGIALRRHGSRWAYRATALVLLVGMTGAGLAVWGGLCRPAAGALLAGGAAAGLAGLVRRGPACRVSRSFALCGSVTFLFLLLAVHQLLPAYARRFALRGQVRSHAALCADRGVPIACYPRRWDSISFYL